MSQAAPAGISDNDCQATSRYVFVFFFLLVNTNTNCSLSLAMHVLNRRQDRCKRCPVAPLNKMLSACLLFLVFNIPEVVSTPRQPCDPAIGTYANRDKVLGPLAEQISKTVQGNTKYSCALEAAANFKFVYLGEERWSKSYPNVNYKKELKYSTVRVGWPLTDFEGLAREAVDKWSSELKEIRGGHFGCTINEVHKRNSLEAKYSIFCLFK
ncbi:hypothetical protein Y032_0067g109 [Ancylostoma ceylanicum]|uniref:Uncharacterized protein n=1 Tax=Ancylostoma ceylanicum TaxID=53326 RepID=A0A016TYH2_9BILA|nr:hypothetical protein Y032_0067g109 [Ancylostoma ceylanicum]